MDNKENIMLKLGKYMKLNDAQIGQMFLDGVPVSEIAEKANTNEYTIQVILHYTLR